MTNEFSTLSISCVVRIVYSFKKTGVYDTISIKCNINSITNFTLSEKQKISPENNFTTIQTHLQI